MNIEQALLKISKDLHHPSREVKFAALDLLRQIDDEKSISLLLKALEDQSWHLREKASDILASKGDIAITPLIDALLEGIWYVRAASAYSLGRIGTLRAILPLSKFWYDENRTVKENVREAFQNIIDNNSEQAIAGTLYVAPQKNSERALEIIKELDMELSKSIQNLLKNPAMIEKEYIPKHSRIKELTEQERNKLLQQLRRRLSSLEIAE